MSGIQDEFCNVSNLEDRSESDRDTQSERVYSVELAATDANRASEPSRDLENATDELSITLAETVPALLAKAKEEIESGETRLKLAAACIAVASERGATQRVIADAVGKSPAWVNRLLKWRAAGYADTPFGPQSKVSRAHVQARKRGPRRELLHKTKHVNRGQQSEALRHVGFDSGARDALIVGLDRLCLADEHALASAARSVERTRVNLGLSWQQLIVTPGDLYDNDGDGECSEEHRPADSDGVEGEAYDGDWAT